MRISSAAILQTRRCSSVIRRDQSALFLRFGVTVGEPLSDGWKRV